MGEIRYLLKYSLRKAMSKTTSQFSLLCSPKGCLMKSKNNMQHKVFAEYCMNCNTPCKTCSYLKKTDYSSMHLSYLSQTCKLSLCPMLGSSSALTTFYFALNLTSKCVVTLSSPLPTVSENLHFRVQKGWR